MVLAHQKKHPKNDIIIAHLRSIGFLAVRVIAAMLETLSQKMMTRNYFILTWLLTYVRLFSLRHYLRSILACTLPFTLTFSMLVHMFDILWQMYCRTFDILTFARAYVFDIYSEINSDIWRLFPHIRTVRRSEHTQSNGAARRPGMGPRGSKRGWGDGEGWGRKGEKIRGTGVYDLQTFHEFKDPSPCLLLIACEKIEAVSTSVS